MKISILTIGSRGDVQGVLALGRGLQNTGHDVRMVTHECFRNFVMQHGVQFAPLAGDPQQHNRSELGQQLMAGTNKLRAVRGLIKAMEPLAVPTARDALAGCEDADLLLCTSASGITYMYGEALREYLGVPTIFLSAFPFAPSQAASGPYSSLWPAWAKKIDWLGLHRRHQELMLDLQMAFFHQLTTSYRKEVFGLPPRPRKFGWKTFSEQGDLWIYQYSSLLLPKPKDWSSKQHLAGYWFLDEGLNWQPPQSLVDYLNDGPPPIYIGFGSVVVPYHVQLIEGIMRSLRRTGQRAVLAKCWGMMDPQDVPPHCYLLESAPHDWLFPRMSAVIHHGGHGTTGAGLRAGVPNMAVPFGMDQPQWAQALYDVGVSPKPVPGRKLNADNFSAALQQLVEDPGLRRKAAALGEKIRAEDGIQNAIDLIEYEMQRLTRKPGRRQLAAV